MLGAVLGALGAIRVMRAVLQTYDRQRLIRDAKEPPPSEDDGGSQ